MFRGLALALIAAGGVLCQCRDSAADEAAFPAHAVDVRVTLAGDGRATIDEEYALTASVRDPVFEFLGTACSDVGSISATADDRSADAPNVGAREPWTFLRYQGASAARSWRVHYEVAAHGSDTVLPVVMPSGPLESEPGGRGARVSITFRWTGTPGAARVVMPRFVAHTPDDSWNATLLAIPSAIRVSAPIPTASCRSAATGSAGGLEWRFAVFALTMVVWAAAYLAWVERSWPARS
ncbi:MAG TPA: hypothetical protein VH583_22000 [Vicinamibacterales bacterium]